MARIQALLALLLIAEALTFAQNAPRQPHTYFREDVHLTDKEIQQIEKGEAVAKIIDTGQKPEVVVFAAVYVDASIDSFVEVYRNVEKLQETNSYISVGRFSDPPRLADVAAMTLEPADIKDLEDCKPGDCEIQLPTAEMEEFKSKVDWSAPNVADQVNRLLRLEALELIARYRKGGNRELGVYMDKNYPVVVDETFSTLLGHVEGLSEHLPEVRDYLLNYPNVKLAGAEEFFYWEKVKFGLKPTLRVNHVILYQGSRNADSPYVLANKQLYASHYLQTAVDLWFCVKDSANPARSGFYLVTVKGSRQHGLTGFKGGLMRPIIVRKTRSSMEKAIASIKRRLEAN